MADFRQLGWRRFLGKMKGEQRRKVRKDLREASTRAVPFLKEFCIKEPEWRASWQILCERCFGNTGPFAEHAIWLAIKHLRRGGLYMIMRDPAAGIYYHAGSNKNRKLTEDKHQAMVGQLVGMDETVRDLERYVEEAEEKRLRTQQAVQAIRNQCRQVNNVV